MVYARIVEEHMKLGFFAGLRILSALAPSQGKRTDLKNSSAAVLTAFKFAKSRFKKMASLPVSRLS